MRLLSLKKLLVTPKCVGNRQLFTWVNIMFNKVDEDRRKHLGPDRTCAEWVLRNGGKVRWKGTNDFLSDYNSLPIEGTMLRLEEVDGSNSSISHVGFPHFVGCNDLLRIILHKCYYIEDEGLSYLSELNGRLKYLQISSCGNITDEGIKRLDKLNKLKTLVLFDLPHVKKKEETLEYLKHFLVDTSIEFK
ncbi:PREDICTED: ATP synthase subunit s, mitochondrial [Nicrophorus vespilloides]|uniref:ATP synthase subunit s, mitochondrial n=1 Tax=Nicrophorus vespilloides TaxID=110193 RepID=A0ABM1N499_NICVS|nr:PREDICTED: ATP synthase subunit s, mitochondrial [Nicrophorus vespilloides]